MHPTNGDRDKSDMEQHKSECGSDKRQQGATAIEYAIMLALVFAVCLAAVTFLGRKTSHTFSTVGSALP